MTPEEAVAAAGDAGIRILRIPTPFAVGAVNCYLIEDEPLTLVDTGPNSGEALDALQRELRELGHELSDIGLVVITHQHIDHLGLTEIVVQHSGAEVAALDLAVRRLGNFDEDAELDDRFAAELMISHGISREVVTALQSVSSGFRAWGSHVEVTRPLPDGSTLELADRSFAVLHRPGHSPSDTIFWDAEREILISADHLIAHISSNPLISRPLDGSGERTQALVSYMDSLLKTREMPIRFALPGHGEPVTDHVKLIDGRFAKTERRKEKIFSLIEERPRTGYEIAQSIWGNVAVTQAFLTLSEVIGHVDLLVNEKRVREVSDGEVTRYEAL